jgi:hypothetical protein
MGRQQIYLRCGAFTEPEDKKFTNDNLTGGFITPDKKSCPQEFNSVSLDFVSARISSHACESRTRFFSLMRNRITDLAKRLAAKSTSLPDQAENSVSR